MSCAVLIPARYASTRFPAKPLVQIVGADGQARSLIEHTWRVAVDAKCADAIYVVTDDERIAEHAKGFGAEVLMTSAHCRNGTERCSEALAMLPEHLDVLVNLQGDAPLTPSKYLDVLAANLRERRDFQMATPVLLCDEAAKQRLLNDRQHGRVGGTTAVIAHDGSALYFSKEVLPFGEAQVHHHVGVYAYRPSALQQFLKWPESPLERSEGLEQLRFLEHGVKVLCVPMEDDGHAFWEVNNPEDIAIVESLFQSNGSS